MRRVVPCVSKLSGGDRRSGRIEEHADYILGVVKRQPDVTAKELRERLINNGTGAFSVSVLWRFLDRKGLTYKKRHFGPANKAARTSRGLAGSGVASRAPGIRRG